VRSHIAVAPPYLLIFASLYHKFQQNQEVWQNWSFW